MILSLYAYIKKQLETMTLNQNKTSLLSQSVWCEEANRFYRISLDSQLYSKGVFHKNGNDVNSISGLDQIIKFLPDFGWLHFRTSIQNSHQSTGTVTRKSEAYSARSKNHRSEVHEVGYINETASGTYWGWVALTYYSVVTHLLERSPVIYNI